MAMLRNDQSAHQEFATQLAHSQDDGAIAPATLRIALVAR